MEISQLFLQRHNVLYEFYLDSIWKTVPDDLMRKRPHPRVNSIAWNIWHLTRAEDAGLNRFVVDRPQILDEGLWMQRINVPWRHHGSGMTFAEVDDLNQRIDLHALGEYSKAVQICTHEILGQINQVNLQDMIQPERARLIVIDEGLAHSNAKELAKNYTGWSKGKCLMAFGLTHSFEHVGELGVIASLLGVVLE